MNIEKFENAAKKLVEKGNQWNETRESKKYGMTSQIFTERLFNLSRIWALNTKNNSKNDSELLKRSTKFRLWSKDWTMKKDNAKVIINSLIYEIKSMKGIHCILMPIKTTSWQCSRFMNLDYEMSKTENKDVAHWVIAAIYPKTMRISFMDSMHDQTIRRAWRPILKEFLRCNIFRQHIDGMVKDNKQILKIKFRKFDNPTVHQYGSLNCGYFCLLYIILTIRGFSMKEINVSEYSSEKYIEKKLKPCLKSNKIDSLY